MRQFVDSLPWIITNSFLIISLHLYVDINNFNLVNNCDNFVRSSICYTIEMILLYPSSSYDNHDRFYTHQSYDLTHQTYNDITLAYNKRVLEVIRTHVIKEKVNQYIQWHLVRIPNESLINKTRLVRYKVWHRSTLY